MSITLVRRYEIIRKYRQILRSPNQYRGDVYGRLDKFIDTLNKDEALWLADIVTRDEEKDEDPSYLALCFE